MVLPLLTFASAQFTPKSGLAMYAAVARRSGPAARGPSPRIPRGRERGSRVRVDGGQPLGRRRQGDPARAVLGGPLGREQGKEARRQHNGKDDQDDVQLGCVCLLFLSLSLWFCLALSLSLTFDFNPVLFFCLLCHCCDDVTCCAEAHRLFAVPVSSQPSPILN